tara:strand:+ start:61 stop:624 length:564 start_codon:yes stop_codon:yes gene_type:complete
MKEIFYILLFLIFAACTSHEGENCEGKILDLELNSDNDLNNKLFNYYRDNSFIEIKDTIQLLRFEKPRRIAHFFQPSSIDSTKRKYKYKAKEAIIKTKEYQWDLLVQIDNDKEVDNIKYWLKSYDNSRNQIGHLDFAGWSADNEKFHSGRIDCDSTLHMILNNGKEHRIFKIDKTGKNILIDRIKYE